MEIGEPKREIRIEPIVDPVPREKPAEPQESVPQPRLEDEVPA